MKILALEKESAQTQTSDFQPHLLDEAAKVYELYQAGVIRELYFHQTDHTAVLILECADADEAGRVVGEVPLSSGRVDHFRYNSPGSIYWF